MSYPSSFRELLPDGTTQVITEALRLRAGEDASQTSQSEPTEDSKLNEDSSGDGDKFNTTLFDAGIENMSIENSIENLLDNEVTEPAPSSNVSSAAGFLSTLNGTKRRIVIPQETKDDETLAKRAKPKKDSGKVNKAFQNFISKHYDYDNDEDYQTVYNTSVNKFGEEVAPRAERPDVTTLFNVNMDVTTMVPPHSPLKGDVFLDFEKTRIFGNQGDRTSAAMCLTDMEETLCTNKTLRDVVSMCTEQTKVIDVSKTPGGSVCTTTSEQTTTVSRSTCVSVYTQDQKENEEVQEPSQIMEVSMGTNDTKIADEFTKATDVSMCISEPSLVEDARKTADTSLTANIPSTTFDVTKAMEVSMCIEEPSIVADSPKPMSQPTPVVEPKPSLDVSKVMTTSLIVPPKKTNFSRKSTALGANLFVAPLMKNTTRPKAMLSRQSLAFANILNSSHSRPSMDLGAQLRKRALELQKAQEEIGTGSNPSTPVAKSPAVDRVIASKTINANVSMDLLSSQESPPNSQPSDAVTKNFTQMMDIETEPKDMSECRSVAQSFAEKTSNDVVMEMESIADAKSPSPAKIVDAKSPAPVAVVEAECPAPVNGVQTESDEADEEEETESSLPLALQNLSADEKDQLKILEDCDAPVHVVLAADIEMSLANKSNNAHSESLFLESETSSTSTLASTNHESTIYNMSFNVSSDRSDADVLDNSIYHHCKAADSSICFDYSPDTSVTMNFIDNLDDTLVVMSQALNKKMDEMNTYELNQTIRLSNPDGKQEEYPAVYDPLRDFDAKKYHAVYTKLEDDSAEISFLFETLSVLVEFGPVDRCFNGIPVKKMTSVSIVSKMSADEPLVYKNSIFPFKFNDEHKPFFRAAHDCVMVWFSNVKTEMLADKRFAMSDGLGKLLVEIAIQAKRALGLLVELRLLDLFQGVTFTGKDEKAYE